MQAQRKLMAAAWLVAVSTLAGLHGMAQPLFTYGKKSVDKEAFLRAFYKNPGDGTVRDAMEAYLPLYINYVLKVEAAYAMGLDTLARLRSENATYKAQLAQAYLAEKAGVEALALQAVARMQQDVQLGHILIQGTDAAARAAEAVQQLRKGMPWPKAVATYCTDAELKAAGGITGWVSPFSIPYTAENIIWDLPVGSVSDPLAGSNGYHVFSKRAVRPGSGQVQVAQVLLQIPDGSSPTLVAMQQALADSLYNLVKTGTPIGGLAVLYSADRSSQQQAGVLAPFAPGTYHSSFEEAAFGLQQPGQVHPPVRTPYGLHILQLVQRIPPPQATDATALADVQSRVLQDGRMEAAKDQYMQQLVQKAPAPNLLIPLARVQTITDTLLLAARLTEDTRQPLLQVGNSNWELSDWIAWVRVRRQAGSIQPGQPIGPYWQQFVQGKQAEWVAAHLEQVEPAFATQYKEFTEANLLFEAMEKKVWQPAQMDEQGLRALYTRQPERYMWGPHATALVVHTADSALAATALAALRKQPAAWRALQQQHQGQLYADSGRYEWSLLPGMPPETAAAGYSTGVQHNALDGMYSFAIITQPGSPGAPRTFEEARGFLISDYQAQLEANWLQGLRKKYPVRIQQKVWQALLEQVR